MSKINIQVATRELKEQSKALLARIKSIQEEVGGAFKEIRALENTLAEKQREEKKAAEPVVERMTAFVMPDEPEHVEVEPEKPAAPATQEQPPRNPLRARKVLRSRNVGNAPLPSRARPRPAHRSREGPTPIATAGEFPSRTVSSAVRVALHLPVRLRADGIRDMARTGRSGVATA